MPSEDYMSDDYVAKLLTKDAKDSTAKYSTVGLQAFLPKRPTTNAPKPNTRFLKNIIRETDNHNAALKAREAEEAKVRLKRLRGQDCQDVKSVNYRSSRDDLHRGEDDRHAKRRRVNEPDDNRGRRRNSDRLYASGRKCADGSPDDDDRYRQKHVDKEENSRERESESSRRQHRHHHRRRRRRSPTESEEQTTRNLLTERSRVRPRSRSRSRSPVPRRTHRRHRSRRRDPSLPTSPDTIVPSITSSKTRKRATHPADSRPSTSAHLHSPSPQSPSSDPLDSIIGPPPPPLIRPRGRGTFASTNAIDSHFASSYDPSVDVRPNSDSDNDWEDALEALRDRERWKRSGAERLREAGFTEAEVGKWEGGGKKREEDVRWAGRGEGREWDRGKVVGGEDVSIEVGIEWGRLKGT